LPRRPHLDTKTGFLKAFTTTGQVEAAAKAVGIDRCNHYDWLKDDPLYPARFEAAKARANVKTSSLALVKARRHRALRDIADGASLRLLEQIARLIQGEALPPAAGTFAPAKHSHRGAPKHPEPLPDPDAELHDQIAREGVFGKRYRDFGSAPAEVQKVIRAVAQHMTGVRKR